MCNEDPDKKKGAKHMENPNTHGKAEQIVRQVLNEWWAFQHDDDVVIGLSIEMQITNALREAGMLRE
jgi:hypothetical protein